MPTYRSIDEARRAFDTYVQIEPRLQPLWDLCRRAAPPERAPEEVHDVFDCDPFESDSVDHADDGWCAEDFFSDHVKSDLLLLTGLTRPGAVHELHKREAFEDIYDLLLNWALVRPCSCCALPDTDECGDGASTHAQP